MPKEIKSAADILAAAAPEGAVAEIASTEPPADAPVAEAVAPAAGFEAPMAEKPATAADVLAEAAAPVAPSAPAPLQAKEAVIPAKPETTPPTEPEIVEAKQPVEPVVKTEWRFVKNVHFGEKIIFADGEEYAFKSPLHIVRDVELAKKILAVAKKYNIVEQ